MPRSRIVSQKGVFVKKLKISALRFQVDEEFGVSAFAAERAYHRRQHGEAYFVELAAGAAADFGCQPEIERFSGERISAAAGRLRQFIVRFEKRDDASAGFQPASRRRNNQPLRRECYVYDYQIDGFVRRVGIECVGPFHHDDALVGPQFPRQFAVAGINGKDFLRPRLEQAVGESADVSAEIRAGQTGNIQTEGFQGGAERLGDGRGATGRTGDQVEFSWVEGGKYFNRPGLYTDKTGDYPDKLARQFLNEAKVRIRKVR